MSDRVQAVVAYILARKCCLEIKKRQEPTFTLDIPDKKEIEEIIDEMRRKGII